MYFVAKVLLLPAVLFLFNTTIIHFSDFTPFELKQTEKIPVQLLLLLNIKIHSNLLNIAQEEVNRWVSRFINS